VTREDVKQVVAVMRLRMSCMNPAKRHNIEISSIPPMNTKIGFGFSKGRSNGVTKVFEGHRGGDGVSDTHNRVFHLPEWNIFEVSEEIVVRRFSGRDLGSGSLVGVDSDGSNRLKVTQELAMEFWSRKHLRCDTKVKSDGVRCRNRDRGRFTRGRSIRGGHEDIGSSRITVGGRRHGRQNVGTEHRRSSRRDYLVQFNRRTIKLSDAAVNVFGY